MPGSGSTSRQKAEGALAAVVALLAPRARVLRDGRRQEVAAESLVPGDVVAVEAGDRVPADLRLLEAQALRAQEAALTGESLPADKAVPAVAAAAPPGDRHCMLHAGTVVVAGTGLGLVVATGAATEVGRIGVLLGAVTRSETPLLRQIARLGGWIAVAVLGFAVLAFLAGTLVHGQPAGAMLLAAVALAVAAIPEELPALVTVTLAVGVGRMARQQALIRNLAAVETLGSVGVICSDKTGTFTRNELVADRVSIGRHRLVASGTGYGPEGSLTLEPDEGKARCRRRSCWARCCRRWCSATMPNWRGVRRAGPRSATRSRRRCWRWRGGRAATMRPSGRRSRGGAPSPSMRCGAGWRCGRPTRCC